MPLCTVQLEHQLHKVSQGMVVVIADDRVDGFMIEWIGYDRLDRPDKKR